MSKWTKEELAIMERALPIIDAVPAKQDQCWPGDAVMHDEECRLGDHDEAAAAVSATEGLSWDFFGWTATADMFRHWLAIAAEEQELDAEEEKLDGGGEKNVKSRVTLYDSAGKEKRITVDFRAAPVTMTGTVTMREIQWQPSDAVAEVLRKNGKKVPAMLTGGVAQRDEKVGDFVLFDAEKLRVKIADKPDLAELWNWQWDARIAESQARTDYWAAEREAKNAEVLAKIPIGSVQVKYVGSAPDPWEAGMSVGVWRAEDGRTFAGDPDVRGEGIGYITEDRLATAAAHYAEDQRRDAEAKRLRAAKASDYKAELLSMVVPPEALATYRKYGGDPEKAWEQEDESAWAEIGRFGPAIEAQGLAYPSPEVIRRELAPEDLTPVD